MSSARRIATAETLRDGSGPSAARLSGVTGPTPTKINFAVGHEDSPNCCLLAPPSPCLRPSPHFGPGSSWGDDAATPPTSSLGGTPNLLAYSRLNWLGLSSRR